MYIKTQTPEQAPDLKEVYDRFVAARGYVPSIMRSMSLKPPLFNAMANLVFATTFGNSSLGRRREEMISSYTSALLNCRY
ncbi:MAG: hypothetical protein HYY96_17035 [Candidatus Tectomicrobia bacterium]|nr:hypothetical protein [Candidatus Tectomicrobia bacterium]